jgi:energy-coupling factor transport system permease protein
MNPGPIDDASSDQGQGAVKTLSPLAYVPRRASLQSAGLGPAALYLGAYLVICFLSSDPLVLVAATLGACLAGYGCHAGRAVRFALRLGGFLAVTMIVINGLATSRGETVLLRLGEWPVFGRIDVTAESLAAGAVIGLRAMGTMVVIAVWSACIDPDRVLRAMHRTARRSALTATLISRLVPLAAADQARLSEAAGLRGPGATPVGRVALAHRLLAGSLDRAVDVAATLELRGYGQAAVPGGERSVPSRFDGRFRAAGGVLLAAAIASLVSGMPGLVTYPGFEYSPDVLSVGLAAMFALGGLVTWQRGRRPGAGRN